MPPASRDSLVSPSVDFAPLEDAAPSFKLVRINAHLLRSSPDIRAAVEEGDEEAEASNDVTTSRYTWWNFAPLFLFESFTKTANVYFLMVSVFQMIPSISPTGGIPTQLFPLVAVVVIEGIFTAVEDYRRHVDDARANGSPTALYDHGTREFESAQWRDIRVGDFIRIANHETVPADVVVLAVAPETNDDNEASTSEGVCYVETKSLDGESNLKRREAPRATRRMFHDESSAGERLCGYVETELPNSDVHSFSGNMYIEDTKNALPSAEQVPLSIKNVLLRGSKVRNAHYAYGLVVNTGIDCKVMSRGPSSEVEFPAKKSSLDQITNRQVWIVVLLLVCVCLVGAITDNSSLADLNFLPGIVPPDAVNKSIIETLAYYLTILCDLVPITLYVTITVVRALQSYFMTSDLSMYDAETDTHLIVRSMQLNEQLGQITHLFADKTGTLTCNKMELRKCTIGGTRIEHLSEIDMGDACTREFFTHLALCHSVLIERGAKDDIVYSASSPDEQALVSGARLHGGVTFANRGADSVTLRFDDGSFEDYAVLETFDFTSSRKRMTVVVRKKSTDEGYDNSVWVLTKGSDTTVLGRLATPSRYVKETTREHIHAFAVEGLRTLVIAAKTLPLADWEEFHARYKHARTDLNQVEAQSQGLTNDIDALQAEMESDLTLLGATAIEDELQDGVSETISNLRVAGVAVWMLTGDMLETAINIGHSCHLLHDGMQCHVISHGDSEDVVLRQLDDAFHAIVNKDVGTESVEHALVISGGILNAALSDEYSSLLLLRLAVLCRAVIACRVSPQQKAQLVALVKDHVANAHTLAVGDGANDVPMLRDAHVGVGIAGQEGMQAVNSSDYAIAQFRFLQPLLFVHGRWNYNRISGLIGYTYYKNIVYSLSLFWFCLRTSSYSGAMMYSPLIQQFYNLIFTVLPIALYAIEDRDLPSKEIALEHPALYRQDVRRTAEFTNLTFWKWVGLAVVDSIALFFVILAASYGVMRHGETADLTVLWSLGWTIMVFLVTLRFSIMVNSWTVFEIGGVVFSIGTMLGVQLAFDSLTFSGEDFNTYSFPWLLERPQLWMGIALAAVGILLKDVFYAAYCRRFRPQLIDIVRESLSLKKFGPGDGERGDLGYQSVLPTDSRRFSLLRPEWMQLTARPSETAHTPRRAACVPDIRQLILASTDPVIFENERFSLWRGSFGSSSGYLWSSDPQRWSDRLGSASATIIHPRGLRVKTEAPGSDGDGWEYAWSFGGFSGGSRTRRWGLVRRRQWVMQ